MNWLLSAIEGESIARKRQAKAYRTYDKIKHIGHEEVGYMETLLQDIRYGLRMLLKTPSFSIVATIALALGIGANTAIFSVVNAVLLRPLPFTNSEQLMMVWETDATRGQVRGTASDPNFADSRDQNHVFERIASYH